MTAKEIKKIIEENWDSLYDISDKVTTKDLLKLCEKAEASEKMYLAIKEATRILRQDSRVRMLLEQAVDTKDGASERRK